MYLVKSDIEKLIEKDLFIRPLLDKEQINEISVDLRLGTDFYISIQGRDSMINASLNHRAIGDVGNFFQESRRRVGETFILHPQQTVLASSLEYIKLPNNVFAVLTMRSTYSRLGLTLSSIVQPGYSGCFSLELTNNNKNQINLTVGACVFQAKFVEIKEPQNYFNRRRKYLCQVRPFIPSIITDNDLKYLNEIWKQDNHILE
ncbi:MAG: dCTP deaminase [Bacteroidales bacterium]|nr:dCTP deaminase [Bacteroidales bacterium]